MARFRAFFVVGLFGVLSPLLWLFHLSGWEHGSVRGILLIGAWGLAWAVARRSTPVPSTHRFLLVFYGYTAFSAACSAFVGDNPDLYRSLVNLFGSFLWVSPYVASYYLVPSIGSVLFAWNLLVGVGFLISGSVFASRLIGFGETIDDPFTQRAFGPFGDNVGFISSSFACEALTCRRYVLFVWHFVAILLTGTRGALFALFAGMLWLFFEWTREQDRSRLAVLARVALLTGVLLQLATSQYFQSTAERFREMEGGIESRWKAMRLGLGVVGSSPFFGVGYGHFRDVAGQMAVEMGVMDSGPYFERGTFSTQNQAIQTATDGGIGAVVLLGFFLWRLFRALGRCETRSAMANSRCLAARVALVAMAVGNQSAPWLPFGFTSGYFLLLLVGLGERIAYLNSNCIDRSATSAERKRPVSHARSAD